jgi:aspergillopepsin I
MLTKFSVLALAIAAQAAPAPVPDTPSVEGSKSFTAPAVHNPNFVRNGTAAMLKAYAKHRLTPTKEMPSGFLAAVNKRQDGSAPASPADGVEYLVSTTVGGQKLNLDFDSGSSDL